MEIGEHERRVSAGYQYVLTNLGDEAASRIDFSLDVTDPDSCPLALATGLPYLQARAFLGMSVAEAIALGFSFRPAYAREDADALNASWHRKVMQVNRPVFRRETK